MTRRRAQRDGPRLHADRSTIRFASRARWSTMLREQTPVIVVDVHAEATSEKMAMGRFLDGSVSFVYGSHTHVQTADEQIFSGGTAYITDVGMTGPSDGVIGMETAGVFATVHASVWRTLQRAENRPASILRRRSRPSRSRRAGRST